MNEATVTVMEPPARTNVQMAFEGLEIHESEARLGAAEMALEGVLAIGEEITVEISYRVVKVAFDTDKQTGRRSRRHFLRAVTVPEIVA
ncbi:MAG: hypothetical protein WDA71_13520 [Actinomycetota bacterium]